MLSSHKALLSFIASLMSSWLSTYKFNLQSSEVVLSFLLQKFPVKVYSMIKAFKIHR